MKTYLYRRGNGNEGNSARALVELKDNENPYAMLRALVVNDYIPRGRVRRHIIRTIEIDGEADYGINATVYDGPDGETEFGAAYITASLEPLDKAGFLSYSGGRYPVYTVRSLDSGARKIYRAESRS